MPSFCPTAFQMTLVVTSSSFPNQFLSLNFNLVRICLLRMVKLYAHFPRSVRCGALPLSNVVMVSANKLYGMKSHTCTHRKVTRLWWVLWGCLSIARVQTVYRKPERTGS
jgi:hypothetical protein